MNTKELKITPPEGFEIDKENSTFECIKFKSIKKKRWRDNENACIGGCFIDYNSIIVKTIINKYNNNSTNYNIFATEKQAKSALAMARISQIMANDERFGGAVTDEEWCDESVGKYSIIRRGDCIKKFFFTNKYQFLSFHKEHQRDLFLEENEDLVKDYLML